MKRVIQIVGYKNSGKTTLVERLVRRFHDEGYQVGTVKHDAHQFEFDTPGTDTWRHRRAGAVTVAIASDTRAAMFEERSLTLQEILSRMEHLDLVLVEGYKRELYPKVVIVRKEDEIELVAQLGQVVAVVSWLPGMDVDLPVFGPDDADTLADWMKRNLL